jgi:hypothetical protein
LSGLRLGFDPGKPGGRAGKRLGEPAVAGVHVVPTGEVWALQVDGEKRDAFSTQNEAITRGGQLAEERQGEPEALELRGQARGLRIGMQAPGPPILPQAHAPSPGFGFRECPGH